MTITRLLIRSLDRTGARWLLSRIVKLRTGVRVEYDGRWVRVLRDGLVLADQSYFAYYLDEIASSERDFAARERSARDNWFHRFSPSAEDVIVDVGAGTGIETRIFADKARHVFAIEAHPETYDRLVTAIRRNGWRNVTPIFAAVTDRQGTVYIEDGAVDEANALADSGLPIPGRTFDDICSEYGIDRIDFLKMNIEGAERLAIKGMTRSIGNVRNACIACHDFLAGDGNEFFATRQCVTDFLAKQGFDVAARTDSPHENVRDHVHANRP